MLTFFVVERSFYNIKVRCYVEPPKKQCNVTISKDRRIIFDANQSNATFSSYTAADWSDPNHWSREAGRIAEQWHSQPTAAA